MPKRDQPKQNKGIRNDQRKNGKAFKQGCCDHRRTRLNEIQKILLNQGAYVNVKKRWAENA